MDETENLFVEQKPIAPKKEKRVARVPVRVALTVGSGKSASAIIETVEDGIVGRVTVPLSEIDADGTVPKKVLTAGVPYGLPWEDVDLSVITSTDLANALRRKGIFTAEDLRANANLAVSIIQSLYRVDVGALNRFAATYDLDEGPKE